MSASHNPQPVPSPSGHVESSLTSLQLAFLAQHYAPLAKQAAQYAWSHVDSLATLLEGEVEVRRDRATKSRMRLARFPVIKTLEQFRWDWPTRINRLPGQNHFHLAFIKTKAHLILLGGVGLGKPQPGNYPSRAECIT
jgi:DNA replication protein DnaC